MAELKNLGIMLDCSRDAVYTVETLKRYMDLMARMGYNCLQLYTEDTYTIDDPYFGYLRGRYTPGELRELDRYALARGIELVPCIQTLAHLSGYLRWNPDVVDCNDILLAGHEPTYALIEKMFAACADCFTSRRINIGMDEAHMVGLGKYLDKHGFENRFEIIRRHLVRVTQIAEKYGFRPMMWSDMFFRLANNGEYYCTGESRIPEDVIALVPENLQLVYWDYYSVDKSHFDHMISAHKQFRNEIVFAGGAWSWTGFVPRNDFSIRSNEAAIRSCLENGVEDVLITCWKDDGGECSLFASLPCMFFTARMAQGVFDREILEREFEDFFGVPYDLFLTLEDAELCDPRELANPCKYMLYSDPFVGFMDWTVDPEKTGLIQQAKNALKTVPDNEYSYLFETLSALMTVLERKYPLGYQLRKAYREGNRPELSRLAEECLAIRDDVKSLHKAFFRQWMAECKPYGFEKHTLRLGGLALRLEECASRIRSYLDGEAEAIPELSEDILPCQQDVPAGKAVSENLWFHISSVKPMM